MVQPYSLGRRTTTRYELWLDMDWTIQLITIQFLDPLLLSLEVYKESNRHVQFLTAAKSMNRKFVGFFSRQMESSTST